MAQFKIGMHKVPGLEYVTRLYLLLLNHKQNETMHDMSVD